MLLVLRQIRVNLQPGELVALAKAAKAHEVVSHSKTQPSYCGRDEDDVIAYLTLLQACKFIFNEDFDLNERIDQEEDDMEDYQRFERQYKIADEFMGNRSGEFEV